MARLLLIGPDHSPQDRAVLDRIAEVTAGTGHQHARVPREASDLLRATIQSVEACDAAVAVLDGAEPDPRVAFVLALARAYRRPILGLRADVRGDPSTGGIPALLRAAVHDFAAVPDWSSDDVAQRVRAFADGVKVFAGALVRDAVPKLLKDEGRELRFRQVADREYPQVLKRKLVETAQRLEESDFGVEQEEIADVLELLETLINLRAYDKESLRSIKEGKWRKRGGFQKGYLLEEEPSFASR